MSLNLTLDVLKSMGNAQRNTLKLNISTLLESRASRK